MSDDVAVGRMVRDLRVARNLRQVDVAGRAGVSRETVSRLERGLVDGMTVASLRAVSRALEMPSIVTLGWRTPELDRMRDRVHAAMVEAMSRILVDAGWQITAESGFNHYGERGSADILAWHRARLAILIVETKSRFGDLQDTLAALDRKRRVLPIEFEKRFGWRPRVVGVLLVLPDLSTHRHVAARHPTIFRASFPHRQDEVTEWLAAPGADLRGLMFLPISHLGDIGPRSLRRRARRAPAKGPRSADSHSTDPGECGNG